MEEIRACDHDCKTVDPSSEGCGEREGLLERERERVAHRERIDEERERET